MDFLKDLGIGLGLGVAPNLGKSKSDPLTSNQVSQFAPWLKEMWDQNQIDKEVKTAETNFDRSQIPGGPAGVGTVEKGKELEAAYAKQPKDNSTAMWLGGMLGNFLGS